MNKIKLNLITDELDLLFKDIIKLFNDSEGLNDYPEFDLSEFAGKMTEQMTLKEARELLKKINQVVEVQKKIIDDVYEKENMFAKLDYARFGYPRISKYNNYYIITIDALKNSHKKQVERNAKTVFSCVYDKDGNILIPFNEENNQIQSLDENNFIIKLNGIKKVDHYKLNDNKCEKVFTVDYNYQDKYSFNKNMSAWASKGLAIVVINNREYLYSIKDAKLLSYGFTKIESIQDNNWEKTDFTKEYNCCRATLDVESDIEFDGKDPNISATLVGYISSDGKLINNFINLESGDIILTPPGKENETEEVTMKDLNNKVIYNLNTLDRLSKNREAMIKYLNLR
ncbi:MAG: hypothetical protein PHG03_01655 [Bacilli bacterium]|nr:hypothetical protein [Bacilli bacterium]MDD4795250.1 hypothetical protein [Bacilli bacterium]